MSTHEDHVDPNDAVNRCPYCGAAAGLCHPLGDHVGRPLSLVGLDTEPARLTVTLDYGDGGAPFCLYNRGGRLCEEWIDRNVRTFREVGPLVSKRAAALRKARKP